MDIFNVKYVLAGAMLSLMLPLTAQGQTTKATYFQDNNYFDFALGAGKNIASGSISWYHLHPLGKRKKFSVGYGIRLTSALGKDQDHITAPARLTSKQEGPQVLFSKTYTENLDTLHITSLQSNCVNISINLHYTISSRLSLGANIDALGFSFGKKVNGIYHSSISNDNNTAQSATPTSFNALLVSDNDYGMLNSEFYIQYNLSKKLGIRGGYEFLFTEYTTDKKLALDNDRYRAKYRMAFLAITYRLQKKI